jgi:biofilm protein TabA
MIVDTFSNRSLYPLGDAWAKAFDFLAGLRPDAEEGFTWIEDRDVYGRVMEYDTVDPKDAKIEAHRGYIDIQTPLVHAEGIRWFPLAGLAPLTEYDAEKDVLFFRDPGRGSVQVDLVPGQFGFFAPSDAHQPKLIVGGASRKIKKAVVKIRLERLPMMHFK